MLKIEYEIIFLKYITVTIGGIVGMLGCKLSFSGLREMAHSNKNKNKNIR